MSRATVYGLYPEKKEIVEIKELRNSHGSASVIWDIFLKEYYLIESYSAGQPYMELLWPRYKDLGIPQYQRAVLMMTYDQAYIKNDYYKRAAEDIRQFLEKFPPIEGNVNHWAEIASILEEEKEAPAIGFQMTSVAENLLAEWDEEKEESVMVPLEDCTNIYEMLDRYVEVALSN